MFQIEHLGLSEKKQKTKALGKLNACHFNVFNHASLYISKCKSIGALLVIKHNRAPFNTIDPEFVEI